MKYTAYKLSFHTGVHFGNGMLNDSKQTFCADTLFSALCIEALKQGEGCLERLYEMSKEGSLLFSDGFPFIGETLYIPKPLLAVEHNTEDVANRKKWKNLSYIPLDRVSEFLSGEMDVEKETTVFQELGRAETRQFVNLQKEESEPYSVGVYHYSDKNGLYFILGYEREENREFVEEVLGSLEYQGLGGKISSGLGKFTSTSYKLPEGVIENMSSESGRFVVLSTSLPNQTELGNVMEDASYLLVKRSGFVQSSTYAEELVKKKDMYFLRSGSIVCHRYAGDIYNVGTKGSHPVWRYGKPILMEV